MKLCGFIKCNRLVKSKGLCNGHYKQCRAGIELKPIRNRLGGTNWTPDLILQRSVRKGDCLLFKADQKSKYPQVFIGGRHPMAYRVVYESKVGPIPIGVHIHHKCANSHCVNPSHLETADVASNNLEMFGRRSYEARIASLEYRIAELEATLDSKRKVSA